MTTPNVHETHVFSFTAAGDRQYRAQCRGCLWHGVTTTDKTRAQDEADGHTVGDARAVGAV